MTLNAQCRGLTFVIEEDHPDVGAYLYIYDNGKCIRDILQNDVNTCKDIAFEEYGVGKDQWVINS